VVGTLPPELETEDAPGSPPLPALSSWRLSTPEMAVQATAKGIIAAPAMARREGMKRT
jgi:hypothetical protein